MQKVALSTSRIVIVALCLVVASSAILIFGPARYFTGKLSTPVVVRPETSGVATQDPQLVFSFELGGGLSAETQYTVKIFDTGALAASSEGMPIIKGGKLTKREYSTSLSQREVAHIVGLAVNAQEFVNNPAAPWPDCRAAEMVVIIGKNRRTRISRRSGCIGEQWSQQAQVAALLQEIGKFLPKTMQGWP